MGKSHCSHWRHTAGTLTFKELRISDPFELQRNTIKETRNFSGDQPDKSLVDFLVIKFIFSDFFVTGCKAGYLYFWKDFEIKTKRKAYVSSPVTVIELIKGKTGEFMIAGNFVPFVNYKVAVIGNVIKLEILLEINVFDKIDNDGLFLSEKCVQSLVLLNERHFVFGQKNGSMTEVKLALKTDTPSDTEEYEPEALDQKKKPTIESMRNIAAFADDEVPCAADFSKDSQHIYCLTQNGLLLVHSIFPLDLIKRLHFRKPGKDLLVLEARIMLVFENEITALDVVNDFALIPTLSLSSNARINKARVSVNKDILAVSLHGHSGYAPKIDVYKIGEGLEKICAIETDEIKLLDFSAKDYYLLYQDLSGQKHIFDISASSVQSLSLQHDASIEWESEGLMISDRLRNLHQFYSHENALVSVARVSKNSIAAVDESGTVSL